MIPVSRRQPPQAPDHPQDWPSRRKRVRPGQGGVAMLVTLVVLVVMLIGAVAMMRSFGGSLAVAGAFSLKRDLVNQADRAALAAAQVLNQGGALATAADRQASNTDHNYSAVMLPANASGLPLALLSDAAFGAVGDPSNDIVVAEQGVRVRWLIERLCDSPGPELVLIASGNCAVGQVPDARGGSASDPIVANQQPQVLYRLSVRVDGPRRRQVFVQSSIVL